MMTHTPGPWELDKHMGDIYAIKMKVDDSRGWCFWKPDNEYYPTREGDFRLIATAPDLLTACKAFVSWSTQANSDYTEFRDIIEMARAAIAQAEEVDNVD